MTSTRKLREDKQLNSFDRERRGIAKINNQQSCWIEFSAETVMMSVVKKKDY